MLKLSSNLKNVYSHHSSNSVNNTVKKSDATSTYSGATEAGKVPAAAILALLGGGIGAAGGYFASEEGDKEQNAIIAGLLGAGAGGAAGYYGAGLTTGYEGRNGMLDPTFDGRFAAHQAPSLFKDYLNLQNDYTSFGNRKTPLSVGQAALGIQNIGQDAVYNITGMGKPVGYLD